MNRTIKYKLYPNESIRKLLDKYFKYSLEVYNRFVISNLEYFRRTGKVISPYTLKPLLTEIKAKENKYQDINRSVLDNVIFRITDASRAARTRMRNLKKQGLPYEHINLPRLKKEINILEFKDGYIIKDNKLIITGIGKGNSSNILASISFRGKNKYSECKQCGEIKIKKDGKNYYLYITYEIENILLNNSTNQIGLDWGINNFLTDNNGNTYSSCKNIKDNQFIIERELQHKKDLKAKTSKQQRNSKNNIKTRKKIRKINHKVYNRKHDEYNNLAILLCKNNKLICIEDLDLHKLRDKKLHHGKFMNKQTSSLFFRILEGQCEVRNVELGKVDPAYTSKACSNCGCINEKLKLKDRNWLCIHCNTYHDRDTNAAKNILNKFINNQPPRESGNSVHMNRFNESTNYGIYIESDLLKDKSSMKKIDVERR